MCVHVRMYIHARFWKVSSLYKLSLALTPVVFDSGSVFPPRVLDIEEEQLLKIFMEVRHSVMHKGPFYKLPAVKYK